MRRFALGLLVAGTLAPAVAACRTGAGSERPNMVLIVVDTLRRDHLTSYGYQWDTSPFLARLASEGVVFENAFSTSAWTAPCTASIFTGLYPFQHGVVSGFWATLRMQESDPTIRLNRIPATVETAAEALKKAGYATYSVTQNPNISTDLGFDAGFDRFHNFPREKDAASLNRQLLEWKGAIRGRQPYFLYLHYFDPHGPLRKRLPWYRQFLKGGSPDMAAYDGEIRFVDEKIREAYQAFGWDEGTVVLVTADHGESWGEHGVQGHSRTLYGEVLDVPLIVRLPGRAHAGRRPADPVSHVDILPTLRALAGLAPDPGLPGGNLLPLMSRGAGALGQRTLYAHLFRRAAEVGTDRTLIAALTDEWKLIRSPEGSQLFDLRHDRREQRDRAGERPEIVQDLAARFEAFERSARKFAAEEQGVKMESDTLEQLKALGYAN